MKQALPLSLLALLALTVGCFNYSQANMPYPAQRVFHAAVEEAMPMRPTRVDDDNMHIVGSMSDQAGNQVEFEFSVTPGYMPNTSSLNVRMEQVKPQEKRLPQWEQDIIERIKARADSGSSEHSYPKR